MLNILDGSNDYRVSRCVCVFTLNLWWYLFSHHSLSSAHREKHSFIFSGRFILVRIAKAGSESKAKPKALEIHVIISSLLSSIIK